MESCHIVMVSSPWVSSDNYAPVAVFTGEGAKERADAYLDTEQKKPEYKEFLFIILETVLNPSDNG